MCFFCCKCVGAGVGKGEIHSGGLGRSKVAVGATFLYFVEGIAEHLIMRFFAVEQKINSFAHFLILNLTVKILIHHLGSLLGCNIGEQIGTEVARYCDIIARPRVA